MVREVRAEGARVGQRGERGQHRRRGDAGGHEPRQTHDEGHDAHQPCAQRRAACGREKDRGDDDRAEDLAQGHDRGDARVHGGGVRQSHAGTRVGGQVPAGGHEQKEEEEGNVSVRSRFAGDEGSDSTAGFIEKIKKEIAGKEIRQTEAKEEK